VVGDDRTRRLVPGGLSALVLLLGLYAVLGPPAATSRPDPSAMATAVLADGVPAAHRTLEPGGPQPRLARHALEKPLLTWAMLLAAIAGGAALRRWSSPGGTGAAPAARKRFTRDSRAPPLFPLPA
jgi:hypothetical protein